MKEINNLRADVYGLTKGMTEQIESAVSGVQTCTTGISNLATNLSMLANPSLLINGNFVINQRGVSVVTSSGYTVDRWKLVSGKFTKTTAGCSLTSGTKIKQAIESFNYSGEKFTASVKIGDDVFSGSKTVSFTSGTSSTVAVFSNDSVQVDLVYDGSNMWFQITANQAISINYAKLEFGSIATPYFYKTYAEELNDCRRYYVKFTGNNSYNNFGSGMAYSATRAFIFVPCVMRATPTLKYSGSLKILVSSGYKSITSIDLDSFTTAGFILTINGSGYTAGNGAILSSQSDSSAYLSFDCEIN